MRLIWNEMLLITRSTRGHLRVLSTSVCELTRMSARTMSPLCDKYDVNLLFGDIRKHALACGTRARFRLFGAPSQKLSLGKCGLYLILVFLCIFRLFLPRSMSHNNVAGKLCTLLRAIWRYGVIHARNRSRLDQVDYFWQKVFARFER